ncbi:MAG: hypothetical protein LUE17_01845 [Planctomycetaceae bacterium]|nr:hypothetical protein [Planctomycetaceae bacterium]
MNKVWILLGVLAAALVLYFVAWRDGDSPQEAGAASGTIRIATKPMSEQFILAEMLAGLIEHHTPLTVTITKGIGGGTANIHPALVKGDFDLYPEYTGTAWLYVLKKDTIPEEKALFAQLQQEYRDQFGLEWVGMYGFNNAFGVALRRDLAQRHNVDAISQLAPLAKDLVFGAEYDFFEREDGYDALCAAYGLEFKQHMDMDINLKYAAIDSGKIDVMNVATTDGQLGVSQAELLRDDKNFYQTYYCGTVVRADTLAAHPELRPALLMMENILNDRDMARLNHEVEGNGREDKAVAREFLQAKGLLP